MKYHLPIGREPGPGQRALTLCGRRVEEPFFLWEGASELVKDRYSCKSCLRSAGQKRQSHQRQEAAE